ncbi:MAG: hypothetical protein RL678_809 [Pseudomonadota bacterium]|jgi:hypothetical protein
MSEEANIFRGDHGPQMGESEGAPRPRRKPQTQAQPVPSAVVPEPAPAATLPAAQAESAAQPAASPAPSTPVVAAKAEPELDFHVDESQLWHSSEAVKKRMAVKKRISDMATVAHQTAHLLDEQAEEAARIARRLKSI